MNYFSLGLIRVGSRCKNETILRFSLVNVRQHYRTKHLIPSTIHHQKRDIMNKKMSSESRIQSNETIIDASYSHLTSLGLLNEQNIIKIEHYESLIGGSGYYRSRDSILNEWLGLDGKVDMINSIENEFDELDLDETQVHVEDEDNEEHDEEERRRDEIDQDEEFFHSKHISAKIHLTSNDDDNDDDEWQTVVNKSKQKQIIHQLLNMSTTLNDENINTIQDNLWLLTTSERYNLYRYWLNKYREKCYKSVSNAHLEYNQAVAAHSQYMQLEDYYILKNAIIVAMTTTCAAKYFDVLQKLGTQKKIGKFRLIDFSFVFL